MGAAESPPPLRTLLLALLILLTTLHKGEGLGCYECNSFYDPNCGNPFKNHTLALTDCSRRFLRDDPEVPGTLCRKITQTVQGKQRVIRSCGFLEPAGGGPQCFARAGTHQVFMHYCHCDNGDGCNEGATTSPLAPMLLGAILFLL